MEPRFFCHFHLKEGAFGLSGKRAAVELSSLILPVLVDHSEDSRPTVGCAAGDAGSRRDGGTAACRSYFVHADKSDERLLLTGNTSKNNNNKKNNQQVYLSHQPLISEQNGHSSTVCDQLNSRVCLHVDPQTSHQSEL